MYIEVEPRRRRRYTRRRSTSGLAIVLVIVLILVALWYFGGQKSITIDPGHLLAMAGMWL